MMSFEGAFLERVKDELAVELPQEYEQLVRDLAPDLQGAVDMDISTDPDWIIQHNRDLRADPAFFFDRKKLWPDHFYVLGEDGNGNAFYLDLRESSAPVVYFLDHEQPDADHIVAANTISDWLTDLRTRLKQYEANAASLEAYESRRLRRSEFTDKLLRSIFWPFRKR
jgi:hypothetical protein